MGEPNNPCTCPAWGLPSPSGLNAHYQGKDLVKVFRALRKAARE